jgi:hypothetical protein
VRPWWRSYRIEAGGRPVKGFTDALTDDAAAAVVAAMRELAGLDLSADRHLRLFARSSPSALAPASTRRVDWCLFRPPKGARRVFPEKAGPSSPPGRRPRRRS